MVPKNNSKQCLGRLFFLLILLSSLQNTAFAQCTTRPAASLQVATNDVCSDEAVSITNGTNEHNNRVQYIWTWGDGKKDTLLNRTTPQHFYTWNSCDTATKDFTVRLDVISIEPGCSNTLFNHVATTQVSVSKKPAAGFMPSRSEVCTDNGLVNFRNTSCPKTVLGLTYLWSFGDPASGAANASNALDPSHTYTVSGNYTVTLTVTGRICSTPSVTTRTILVRDPAVAKATYSGTACAPASFKFTNESVGDVTSAWSVSPSTGVGFSPSPNDRNPIISFARTGDYVVTLQITNPCGSKTWKSQTISILAPPSLVAIARIPNFCAGGSATPILSSSNEGGAPTTYNWTFEGGSPASSVGKVAPSVSWASAGIFKVIVEATNTCGSKKDTAYAIVGDLAAINVTKSTNSPSNCTPTTRTYTNTSTGSPTVLWTITPNIGTRYVNSTAQNSKSPSIEFTQKGTYFVKMEMVNACGNNVYLDTIVVKTDPSVSIADLGSKCSPASFLPQILTENDGGSAISRYLWTFTGAAVATFEGKTPPSILFDTSGTVTLTVFNDCGSFSTTKAVTVNQAVRVAVSRTALPPTNCGPFDVTYNNVSTGGSTYNWTITPSGSGLFQFLNTTDLSSKNPSIRFLKSGTYYVRLVMPSGCQNGEYLDTIVVKTAPSVSVADLAPQCSPASFSPQILTENDGGSAISRYYWTFTGATVANFEGKTPTNIRFDSSGTMALTVVNGCDSFTITKAVTVNQAVRIDVSRSALPLNNCGPFEVTYLNKSMGSNDFKWSVVAPTNGAFLFTNSTTDVSKTPTIKFLKSGTYIVKSLMQNDCKSGNYEDTINVFTKPDIRLESVAGDCIPVTINPKATVVSDGGGPLSIAWILGGGTPNAATNLDGGTVVYAVGGIFKQVFKATNLCGETADSTEITARDRANVVFESTIPTKVCTVDAPFVVNVSPPNIGVLTGSGLTSIGTFDPSIAPRGANVLTYKVGVGRCQDSGKITVNVFGTTVEAGRDTVLCGAIAADFPLIGGTRLCKKSPFLLNFPYFCFSPFLKLFSYGLQDRYYSRKP